MDSDICLFLIKYLLYDPARDYGVTKNKAVFFIGLTSFSTSRGLPRDGAEFEMAPFDFTLYA